MPTPSVYINRREVSIMKDTIRKREYGAFLAALKEQIESARKKAYQTVNRQLVELYLCLGEAIYEKVEISMWGAGIVERLARDLQMEFPDMRGLSARNLWEMKKLYETYRDCQKLQPLVAELTWSHNLVILHRTTSIEEREFYIKACLNEKWSRRELERQIDSSLYERFMLSRKTDKLIPHTKEKNAIAYFKDEYVFDFLGLKDDFAEKELRKAIMANLRQFFLCFGNLRGCQSRP